MNILSIYNMMENHFPYIFVNCRLWYHPYQGKHGNVKCLFVEMMEYLKKILLKIEEKAWKFLLTSKHILVLRAIGNYVVCVLCKEIICTI